MILYMEDSQKWRYPKIVGLSGNIPLKSMMTRGSPISGNLHMSEIWRIYWDDFWEHWEHCDITRRNFGYNGAMVGI